MKAIVKMQLPLQTNALPRVLIYDRDRRHETMPLPTDEIYKAMGTDMKAFFYAEWKSGAWHIGKRAPWQGW